MSMPKRGQKIWLYLNGSDMSLPAKVVDVHANIFIAKIGYHTYRLDDSTVWYPRSTFFSRLFNKD